MLSDHNKIHAADVLHACYYLTTQSVPNLKRHTVCASSVLPQMQSMLSSPAKKRVPLIARTSSIFELADPNEDQLQQQQFASYVGVHFTPLELLALYCSAAMHDYEHPGRNNQFLVSISSPLVSSFSTCIHLECTRRFNVCNSLGSLVQRSICARKSPRVGIVASAQVRRQVQLSGQPGRARVEEVPLPRT